jgi:alginate O-acetyltransferase complex protein AlgI
MAFIPIYILILFFTIIIDYAAGIMIERETGKRRNFFLVASILANVGVLMFFKYYNFFTENVNALLALLHVTTYSIPLLKIILPIGLSFHTFQAMSYTIEVYRGHQKAERHLGIYALYVMFYPQLVAGPIERPQNLLQQFKAEHKFNSQNLLDGLRLMLWGLFKKAVIADRLALYVTEVYKMPTDFHYINIIIAILFFTIQIYCDFSGYSDMAIGAAKAMGFELMINFNRPYFSKNIQEFWKRWHISLSTWFRDYVYISLGGNRLGIRRVYFNMAVVFLISGFWHGANWTFIIWGAIHAIGTITYMIINRVVKIKLYDSFATAFLGWFFTFSFVAFAWIFFRAENLTTAVSIIKSMLFHDPSRHFRWLVGQDFGKNNMILSTVFISIMLLVERMYSPNLFEFNHKTYRDVCFCGIIFLLTIIFGVFNNTSFIYFQF